MFKQKKRNAFQFEMNEQTPKKQILRSKQKKNLDHKNHRVYSPMKKNVIDVKKKMKKDVLYINTNFFCK